jgi:FdhE protein
LASRLESLRRGQPALSQAATLCERMLAVLFGARLARYAEPMLSEGDAIGRLAQSQPLLRGTAWRVDDEALRQGWLDVCAAVGSAEARMLAEAASDRIDLPAALRGVVQRGPEPFRRIAEQHALPPALACSVLRFAALPLLQPWAARCEPWWEQAHWARGYCPMCGSWPLLSEYRGLEQFRFLRCALCGSSWPADRQFCPCCETRDHGKLMELKPEGEPSRLRATTCDNCRTYLCGLSSLTRLSPAELLVAEVETLPLACAAEQRGYAAMG